MIRTMKKCPRCGFLITPGCGCGCGPGTIKTVEPLPAMPASVRELVEQVKANAQRCGACNGLGRCWSTSKTGESPCPLCAKVRTLAAAVEAHYAGGA